MITTELIGGCADLRVELEDDAGDLDVVAGLEPGRLQRADHTEPAQTALEVRERVLVVEVVARDQPLDASPLDDEAALVVLRDAEAAARRRAEDAVLGQLVRAVRLAADRVVGVTTALVRRRRSARDPAQQLGRQLVEALARGRRGERSPGTSVPEPLAASSRARLLAPARASTRSAFDSARIRGSVARRGS